MSSRRKAFRPWLDREDILPGMEWDREIVHRIKQSHSVLFCLSKRSRTKRGYIQKELRTALEAFQEIPSGHTFLIPVRLEECTVPDELSKYQ
ncbi:MAG: toll/interleukin-1 receptor domain-containing protein [Bryobacteraceae bacterium]